MAVKEIKQETITMIVLIAVAAVFIIGIAAQYGEITPSGEFIRTSKLKEVQVDLPGAVPNMIINGGPPYMDTTERTLDNFPDGWIVTKDWRNDARYLQKQPIIIDICNYCPDFCPEGWVATCYNNQCRCDPAWESEVGEVTLCDPSEEWCNPACPPYC